MPVMNKNYYHILNLTPSASEEDIKQAYRSLAKQYHPDVNSSSDAHEKFLEISEAYECLIEQAAQGRSGISDYDPEDPLTKQYIEELRRKAKERAHENARRKSEKKKKAQEEYQESGLYDVVLVLSYLGRILLFVLCIVLITIPFLLDSEEVGNPFIARAIVFIIGGTGLFFILRKPKSFFYAGSFFYNFKKLRFIFNYVNEASDECCYYTPGEKGNSKPYRVNMVKIKDIKFHNYGIGQHSIAFDQKSVNVDIPRSRKAFIIHAVLIVLKFAVLLSFLIFLKIDSLIWRVILGILAGFLISRVLLFVSRTRSTSSFLVTPSLVIRCLIWLNLVVFFSHLELYPFNIYSSSMMNGVVVFIFILDTFLDQFLNFISGKKFNKPIFSQPPQIVSLLEKKYQFGYEMPVLSVFYPLYKWFLG